MPHVSSVAPGAPGDAPRPCACTAPTSRRSRRKCTAHSARRRSPTRRSSRRRELACASPHAAGPSRSLPLMISLDGDAYATPPTPVLFTTTNPRRAPSVDEIAPDHAPLGGGVVVSLSGAGFSPAADYDGGLACFFGSLQPVDASFVSATASRTAPPAKAHLRRHHRPAVRGPAPRRRSRRAARGAVHVLHARRRAARDERRPGVRRRRACSRALRVGVAAAIAPLGVGLAARAPRRTAGLGRASRHTHTHTHTTSRGERERERERRERERERRPRLLRTEGRRRRSCAVEATRRPTAVATFSSGGAPFPPTTPVCVCVCVCAVCVPGCVSTAVWRRRECVCVCLRDRRPCVWTRWARCRGTLINARRCGCRRVSGGDAAHEHARPHARHESGRERERASTHTPPSHLLRLHLLLLHLRLTPLEDTRAEERESR